MCPYLHGITKFGPSCIEFAYPGCLHFDDDTTQKIDDVLIEHGGVLQFLPLAVQLNIFA